MTLTRKPLPKDLLDATEVLAETLAHAEPILEYNQARAMLDAAPSAQELVQALSQAQADLRRHQANGGVNKAEIERVRKLQTDVQENPTIIAYATAQQAALAFLPDINRQISELIGFDFAALGGQSSC